MLKKNKGFTLIELLAVVVIIAIIAAIGIYSVITIINKTKETALSNTALSIRKAVRNHLADEQSVVWVDNTAYLDITPGTGNHANLIDLSTDPWGKDYQNITAVVVRNNGKYEITIYIILENGNAYELTNTSTKVIPVQYTLDPLTLSGNVETGDSTNVSFTMSELFGMPIIVDCDLIDNDGNESSYYTCGNLITDSNGYSLPVQINKAGIYKIKITYRSTKNSEINSQLTDNITVTNSTKIVMDTSYSTFQNTPVAIGFEVTSNFNLATIKDEAGNTLIANPQRNTDYTFNKTYANAGTYNDSIVVTDNYGNVVTRAYTITVNTSVGSSITAVSATSGYQSLNITGSVATPGTYPIAKWQYKVGAGAWQDIPSSNQNAMPAKNITGLTNGTAYTISVRALDQYNTASNTRTVTATPNGYTVTFGTDGTVTLSGATTQNVLPNAGTTAVAASGQSGYIFSYWLNNYGNYRYTASITLSNITRNETWTAYGAYDGSCPFLYVWDGSKYNFESDLYPKSRLGGLTSKGYTKPQPNDYYVLKTAPVVKNNFIETKLTTELREAHYTDEMKMYAIDLPIGKSIETFQPITGTNFATLKDSVKVVNENKTAIPVKIVETDVDISSKVAKSDRVYGIINPNRNEAIPQTIELDLGDLSAASRIKLVIDAAAYTPSAPIPRANGLSTKPIIKVINNAGEWQEIQVNIQKPGEYQRKYLVDLTGKFLSNNYKVRVTYNNTIYFDSILLDTANNDDYQIRELTLDSAVLSYHGRNATERINYLSFSKYGKGEPFKAYLEGNYTRFGDVKELLLATDDKFVIAGSGDEISMKWNPISEPVAAGMKRHYVVYVNGYYKYLLMPIEPTINPLPFKAMSNFPYLPSEFYPNDPDHFDYLTLWNTRFEENTTGKPKTIN